MRTVSNFGKSMSLAFSAATTLYLDTLSARKAYATQARCAIRDSFSRGLAKIKSVPLGSFCARLPFPASIVNIPAHLDNEGIGDSAYLITLATVCASLQPKQIVEFGTFLGLSSYVFALNSKASHIMTVDLPDDAGRMLNLNEVDQRHVTVSRSRVGMYYKDTPESSRIAELKADSRQLRLRDHVTRADLVLVDGGHDRACISADTDNALAVTKPGSVILWDDYFWLYPDVVEYLDAMSDGKECVRLEHTNLVGHIVS